MSVQFRRLRIAGFKSFAEPVSVEIHPGLTGIVGPNGCGKSNVVEALRWAMGEQSTRSLRAGEMDDVIFAGTAGRPSRNLAEVTLTLDETAGAVPPPFHEQAELEIIRRIERGSGSDYRVNGKEVRARDVQTLFADLATGAHASGMVSQGRVGALVTAKPEDRRAVLEEAAGITGLHARRHEAELKLRAAEANLARAEDLRGQLEVQLGALKRQARQASRYRNISGAIRQAEAELLSIQRARAEAVRSRGAGRAARRRASRWRGNRGRDPGRHAQATEAAAALPPLRAAESDARTALERHRVAQEQIAAEEERARAALADAATRLRPARPRPGARRAAQARLGGGRGAARRRGCGAGGGRGWPCGARARRPERRSPRRRRPSRLAEAEANRATEAAARGERPCPGGGAAARRGRAALAPAGRAARPGPRGARPDRRPGGRSGGAGRRPPAEQAAAEAALTAARGTGWRPSRRGRPPARRWPRHASGRRPRTRRTPGWPPRRMRSRKCWR